MRSKKITEKSKGKWKGRGHYYRIWGATDTYKKYLKDQGIKFRERILPDGENVVTFKAVDRLRAKKQFRGVAGLAGVIFKKVRGKEKIVKAF